MKKQILKLFFTVLAVLSVFSANVSAQTGGGEFRITGKSIVKRGDHISVAIDIEAYGLKIGNRASLDLVPTLRAGNNEIALQGLRYQGKDFQGEETAFLKVYRGVERYDILTFPYIAEITYAPWMDHAGLVFRQFLREGDKVVELPEKVLIHDIAVNNTPVDDSWKADRSVYTNMVMFLQPEVEKVKNRSANSSVKIDYPSGKTNIIIGYGNNAAELNKIDKLFRNILDDKMVTVNSITITGYSSPEGTYAANQRLATARAKSFQQYLMSKHDLRGVKVVTGAVGEDWDGLVELIDNSHMPYKDEVLNIIASTDIFDGREKKLMLLKGGNPYRDMLQNMFPALRRIGIEVDYAVRSLTDAEARELLYSRPEMLSLSEMMRVASYYEPGSRQYREVYEIAARHYPHDVIASNNAAAAVLMDGDHVTAARYLKGIDDSRTLVNRGVVNYIAGDVAGAERNFGGACDARIEKGCSDLRLLRGVIEERNRANVLARAEYERVENVRNTALTAPLGISINRCAPSFRFAVKTNLLEWAGIFPDFSGLRSGVNSYGMTPNLEAEVFFGGRWSVNVNGSWTDFKTQDDRLKKRWAINGIGVEPRVWFNGHNAFKGFYAGIYGNYGEFNMAFDDREMPLSGDIFSAGLSVGYAYLITPRWSIEAGLRGGYYSNDYFKYFYNAAKPGFEWYSDHKKDGFGLHSIRLSVGYRFGGTR